MSTRPLSYEPFFGLRQKPFSLAPDPEFLYESPTHATALNGLLAGIRRREGLLALTGDVGTGKTTICRALLRSLDQTTFSAFIPDPFASREDLLKMLLIDFGVVKIQDFTTGPLANARRTELSYLLSSFLETLVPLDAFVVVFIDEAQKMSPSLIEEVRILSDNFCRHGQLQIVFVGQLELMDTLKSPNLRHVDQRVCVYCKLEPLSLGDVAGYINRRLQVAGGTPGHPMFAPGALALIHEAACGVPRLMNRLCDRALHEAFRLRLPIVDRELLQSVLDDGPATVAVPAPADKLPVATPKPITVPQPIAIPQSFAGAPPLAIAQRPAVVRPQTDAPSPAASPAAAAPGRASAVPTPAPRATGAAFATQVDAWLAELDTGPASVAAIPPLEEPAWAEETPPSAPAPRVGVDDNRDVVRRPYRYIERIGRRWARGPRRRSSDSKSSARRRPICQSNPPPRVRQRRCRCYPRHRFLTCVLCCCRRRRNQTAPTRPFRSHPSSRWLSSRPSIGPSDCAKPWNSKASRGLLASSFATVRPSTGCCSARSTRRRPQPPTCCVCSRTVISPTRASWRSNRRGPD
jgi:type II secretory pathway predicted ATPase ExeA